MTDANEHYLRKHENEMVTAEEYREEREFKIKQESELLKYNRDSVIDALREGTYSNDLLLSQLHVAYVNRDTRSIGKALIELLDNEIELEAERIVD